MGRIVVSENVSLDGVVEDPTGEEGFWIDWTSRIRVRTPDAESTRTRPGPSVRNARGVKASALGCASVVNDARSRRGVLRARRGSTMISDSSPRSPCVPSRLARGAAWSQWF